MDKQKQKTSPSYGKKNWKKLFLIYAVVGVIIYLGVFFFLMQKKSANYSKQTVSPTSKASLNPNTGNLYQDINMRLKEVIK